ncbi:hypothetical protein [Streptomyces sp. NPDC059639]|uniref:hypothetical protein n=1 Tax=Streptomyces sp. NPDC059639 TaxID=3346891 RepID=UPI00367BE3BE
MTSPDPANAPHPGRTPRDRAVLRVRFDLSGSDAQEVLYEQLLGLVEDITPVYQPHPADHSADLDVTGAQAFFDRALSEIAAMLQLRAIALHGVHVTIGGGRSPMLAAMAAAAAPLGRTLVIAADDDAVTRFLRPRPLTDLPGIGPSTAKVLARYGITAIGHLTTTPAATLARIFSPHATRELAAHAAGIDPRPVQRTALVRSTSSHHRFESAQRADPASRSELRRWTQEFNGSRLDGIPLATCSFHPDCVTLAGRDYLALTAALPDPPQVWPARTGVVVVLTTWHDSHADWLQAGQALQRVLLYATAYRGAAAFHTQPLEIPALRADVRALLSCGQVPQMLLRLGHAEPGVPTPRRPASAVLRAK